MDAKQIRENLKKQRNQKFRTYTDARIDGLVRVSAENKAKAQTKEGKAKLKERSRTSGFKNRDCKSYWQTEEGKAKAQKRADLKKKENNPEFSKKLSKLAKERLKDPRELAAHRQRIKDFFADPVKLAERNKKITLTRGWRCQIKEPGKDWKTFNAFSEAGRYYNWTVLGIDPKAYFPVDGSIKIIQKGKRKGWQFRRISSEN